MAPLPATSKHIDYWVEEYIQKRFFEIEEFTIYLQEFLRQHLSTEIEINVDRLPSTNRRYRKQKAYRVRLVHNGTIQSNTEQNFHNLVKTYLDRIQTRVYHRNDKTLKWLNWSKASEENLIYLQTLFNQKIAHMSTVLSLEQSKFSVHYLPTESFNMAHINKFTTFIEIGIAHEIIVLPLSHERSEQLEIDLDKIVSEQKDNYEVSIKRKCVFQQEIHIIGYMKQVSELKQQILDIIEKNVLVTYELNIKDEYGIRYMYGDKFDEIQKIEEQYSKYGVQIQLKLGEFSAPRHLKDEIKSRIEQLWLSPPIKTTFNSEPLHIDDAQRAEQYLPTIARYFSCHLKTQLKVLIQPHLIPKATVSNKSISKSIEERSNQYLSSSYVFKKIILGKGSIELRNGDIASQRVDTIVISTMLNGLKDGVIEQLGKIDYEKSYLENDGTMYTETRGGQLSCRRVLFTNWLPKTIVNSDNTLRQLIKSFMSKSIEYSTREQDIKSIAFAVPDSCTNETILAEEMVNEAKRQIEISQLQLNISFVCLSEQQTLYDQFSNTLQNIQEPLVYFEWPSAIIEITIAGSESEQITACQNRLNQYLSRYISTLKITFENGVFSSWDQQTINSFYKYCNERCVLPKMIETNDEIQLIGSPANNLDAKKKLQILSALINQSQTPTSTTERPSSAAVSDRPRTSASTSTASLYNIVLSYSPKDQRKCRRLIHRLTKEGFSVGTHINTTDTNQLDPSSLMNKCDCILLCISENYYLNDSCREEAKYAFQTDKKVFLVNMESCPILGWDNNLFEGKIFFHSYGSDHYFDLEYERLLIELLRHTKPGFVSMLKRRSSQAQLIDANQLDNSQIPIIHNQNNPTIERTKLSTLKVLPSIPKTTVQQSAKTLSNLKNIDLQRQLSFFEERWLRKLMDIPKPSLFLMASEKTWDSSQYKLRMPAESYTITDLSIISIFPAKSNGPTHYAASVDNKQMMRSYTTNMLLAEGVTYGTSTSSFSVSDGISQVFFSMDSIPDFIPRRSEYCYLYGILGCGVRTDYEIRNRQRLDDPQTMQHVREKFAQYFLNKYKKYTKKDLDVYLKFAQRMKENAVEFEKFCSRSINVST